MNIKDFSQSHIKIKEDTRIKMVSLLIKLYDLACTVTYAIFVIIFCVQQRDKLSQVYTLF